MKVKSVSERVRRAAGIVVEGLERRQLFAALSPSATVLVFNASTTGGLSHTDTLTLTNTGSSALSFGNNAFQIIADPSDSTNESAQFAVSTAGFPSSLAPGQSGTVTLTYQANVANTIQKALLQITDSDPTTPITDIQLHGLGTNGQFGYNEPSLANIFTANDIPTNTGETDLTNSQYPQTPSASDQEVPMQRLVKAGSGPVTITPLASFNSSVPTTVEFGYYTPGDPTDTTQLFTIGQNDAQTVTPTALGATSFDPGTNPFGLYASFPGTSTSTGVLDTHYSENELNTLDPSAEQKFRFFPLETANGTVVPNTYVIAAEDYNDPTYNSFENFVGIISNVTAAPNATNAPVLGLQNLDGLPGTDTLVFNRIQNTSSLDPAGFVDAVHDTDSVQINNTGDQPLVISSITLSDNTNWEIVNPPAAGTAIAAGGTLDVEVKFIAQSVPPNLTYNQTNDSATTTGLPVLQAGGVWNGTLSINSNDPVNPTRTLQLAGYWQNTSESEMEPGLQTITNLLFGWGTTIDNTEQPDYPDSGSTPVYYGEEVNSPYWEAADPSAGVSVVQIDAFHNQYFDGTQTTAQLYYYPQNNSDDLIHLMTQGSGNSQSLFPSALGSSGSAASASFNPTGVFGFNLDGEYSDNSLNTTDISLGRSGHAVRFYPLRNASGVLIPNTWLMVMDYENSQFDNSDFQDNAYIVTNMRPAATAPAVEDLEAFDVNNGVELQWAPVNDPNLIGYNVYSSSSPTGTFTKLNSTPITATSYIDTSAPGGAPTYYHITAVDSSGESEAADASAQPLGTLLTTLTSADINSQPAGSTSVVTPGSAYTVTAGGADIGGSQLDGFRYVYEQVTGNFDAEVQISSLTQNVQPNSRAGLMVRDSLDAGSQMVFAGASATDGYRFNYRTTEGQIGVYNTIGSVSYPNVWVRLVRIGNDFSAYSSPDGSSWTLLGSLEMDLPSTLYLGMAVCSHSTTQTVTAQFQNYSEVPSRSLPPPPTTETIFGSNSAPASNLQNVYDPPSANGSELGMEFTSSVSGTVTGVRFYKGSQDTGTQSGELWSSTGQLLATATFTNESASGWQQVNFSTAVAISANTVYIVSYHTTSPYLAYTPNEFASSITNGSLTAPAEGIDGNNGVYAYGSTPTFPTSYNGQAPYYWVDVVFSPAAATVPAVPTGLAVTNTTSSSVSLAWAASSGATSYVILRETSGGQSYAQIGTSTTTSFTDTTAAPNTTYSYQVEAVSTAGSSAPSASVNATTLAAATIYSASAAPTNPNVFIGSTSGGVELGLKFTSDVAGTITGVRFYKGSQTNGTQTGELWSSSGQLLATATFTNESASGWQQVNFSTPVAISADTVYIIAYHTTSTYIAYSPNVLSSGGIDNGNLHALANGVSGNNSVYSTGASSFPSLYNGQAGSYLVDVVFSAATVSAPATPTGVAVSGTTASSVSLTWNVASGATSYELLRKGPSDSSYVQIGTSTSTSYTDSTVTASTTYSYEVIAVNSAGDSSPSSAVSTTTPAAAPLSIWNDSAAPASNNQNIFIGSTSGGVELGMKFQSSVAGTITGVQFYKGSLDTGTHTAELWSSSGQLLATATFTNETASGWQQVTFSTPVAIAANTTYIVSYHTNASNIAYTPNLLSSSVTNGPLTALGNGVSGNNSVYSNGASSFPTLYNGQAGSYWVDVLFTPS